MAQGSVSYRCSGCGRAGEGWCNTDLNPPVNLSHCPDCGRVFCHPDMTMSQALKNQIRAEETPEVLAARHKAVEDFIARLRDGSFSRRP
jgi:DNA-directed RNA polymerase subunit RPC12/RpoP